MARIRKIEIRNFRSIRTLDWLPTAGVNCLIGPGDSGKSTVLDAIDMCLGARRTIPIGDTDFFGLDVTQSISISLTIGSLSDALKNLDVYGDFLRAFNPATGEVEDEPRHTLETVLTLNLTIASDLEPVWSLTSQRAQQKGLERGIAWKDKVSIAPARLGSYANTNLSWTKGSVLNRLSEERANLGAELARAAREARVQFGEQAGAQLTQTLEIVTQTAAALGVPIGGNAKALLDAHSVSISDGAIALHSDDGVPLRALGTGSTRLLIAGLQRAATNGATIVLVDELEYGLEPHRLTRLLDSLGAKMDAAPLQVFMTTHSPVAVRELNGNQVFVVRAETAAHQVRQVGIANEIQSTIRLDPEAFLAKTIIVCEGASEVGFVRGLDQHWVMQGFPSLLASSVSYINVGGSEPDRCFVRGLALLRLGYRVIVLVDNDVAPTQATVNDFTAAGGRYISWRPGRALEDELFLSVDNTTVQLLLDRAIELTDDGMVDEHIISQSQGGATLQTVLTEGQTTGFSVATRTLLGLASRRRKNGWFKSVTKFEGVARDIVGPNYNNNDPEFLALVNRLFEWAHAP